MLESSHLQDLRKMKQLMERIRKKTKCNGKRRTRRYGERVASCLQGQFQRKSMVKESQNGTFFPIVPEILSTDSLSCFLPELQTTEREEFADGEGHDVVPFWRRESYSYGTETIHS